MTFCVILLGMKLKEYIIANIIRIESGIIFFK